MNPGNKIRIEFREVPMSERLVPEIMRGVVEKRLFAAMSPTARIAHRLGYRLGEEER